MWAIIESALDLVSVFVDFLRVSSVSVSVLQFVGIILAAFLLGVLFGRITKRGVPRVVEDVRKLETDRVSLDFERLTPLGPSQEEAAENATMDIADLRTDRVQQESARGESKRQKEPTLLKE